MKREFNARISGHDLYTPDKSVPSRQAARLKLDVASQKPQMGKPTKAVLPIELEELDLPEFKSGQYLRITIQDSQQAMNFAPDSPAKKEKNGKQPKLGLVDDPKETKPRGRKRATRRKPTPGPQPGVH